MLGMMYNGLGMVLDYFISDLSLWLAVGYLCSLTSEHLEAMTNKDSRLTYNSVN